MLRRTDGGQIVRARNRLLRFNFGLLYADLGEEELARKLAGRALVGNHEDRHAW
jgi:hypothetical protein